MDPARRLNDLNGREWLPKTRSAHITGVENAGEALDWDNALASFSVLSKPGSRDESKKQHPATFPEEDAQRLIQLFTRRGQQVLDPFIGVGSTAVACAMEHRPCLGFELYEKWSQIAAERVSDAKTKYECEDRIQIKTGDALDNLSSLESESQQFILTSPPYWGILNKIDHKAKTERTDAGLATDYGDNLKDLSQINTYSGFLSALETHFVEWHRVLVDRGYVAVVVSDFRHQRKYYPFHADIGSKLENVGFTMQGLIVVVQDSKRLYPYGYPTTFVPNICNQFVVVARKL